MYSTIINGKKEIKVKNDLRSDLGTDPRLTTEADAALLEAPETQGGRRRSQDSMRRSKSDPVRRTSTKMQKQ